MAKQSAIAKLVDQLVADYRDAIRITADDLADPQRREELCFELAIDDSELTEEYAIEYAVDGVGSQHSYDHNEASDRAIVRECKRRLNAMGAASSF